MPPRTRKNDTAPADLCPWHFPRVAELIDAGYVAVSCEHGSWPLPAKDSTETE